MSPSRSLAGGTSAAGAWLRMEGNRRGRGSGVGSRGLVVEVHSYAIARHMLGYSMGLILEARGSTPSPSCGDSIFYTLGFAGSHGRDRAVKTETVQSLL